MDEGLQMLILMGVILKIPVGFACWLVWYAMRQEPDPVEGAEDEGPGRKHYRREPKPKFPRGPRRGPHAPDSLPLPCPENEEGLRVSRRGPLPVPTGSGSAHEHR